MQMKNCPECGKVFTFIRTNMCPACQQKDEEEFRKVRAFLAKNPGANIISICEGTEVEEEKIIRYIREGRIYNASALSQGKINVECELCGKLITTGRYCTPCIEKLSTGLKRSINEENQKAKQEEAAAKSGPRMHTADFWKDRR